jgi:pimeloyl-ACP methyl ester carboxylesterase
MATIHAQDKFFNSNGVRIRYTEQGSGEPVVLVHGLTGNIELNWVETGVMQGLVKDYRVIALDCRGHGKSDKPHDPSAYGGEMGQDVIRLLDHLHIRKAHMVGYSMGSRIIGHLLTTDPDRFRTATLGASPPRRNWSTDDERRFRERADQFERSGDRLPVPPEYRKRISDKQVRAVQAYFDGRALAALLRSCGQQAVTDAELSTVKVPILAIVGTADVRLEGMRELKGVIPRVKLVELEHATHISACTHPEFVKTISAFLASHSGD